jgi:hypothetical protein
VLNARSYLSVAEKLLDGLLIGYKARAQYLDGYLVAYPSAYCAIDCSRVADSYPGNDLVLVVYSDPDQRIFQ